jgi:hypothetical protein
MYQILINNKLFSKWDTLELAQQEEKVIKNKTGGEFINIQVIVNIDLNEELIY